MHFLESVVCLSQTTFFANCRLFHVYYTTDHSIFPNFTYQPDNIWKTVRVMKLLITYSFPFPVTSFPWGLDILLYYIKIKVKQSRNRPGVAQRVPGVLSSQISMKFGTWRLWGCQPHPPVAFTPCSWYSFPLEAESTPGPWYGRKEYVNEKSNDTIGNRSRDRPTSSAAP